MLMYMLAGERSNLCMHLNVYDGYTFVSTWKYVLQTQREFDPIALLIVSGNVNRNFKDDKLSSHLILVKEFNFTARDINPFPKLTAK